MLPLVLVLQRHEEFLKTYTVPHKVTQMMRRVWHEASCHDRVALAARWRQCSTVVDAAGACINLYRKRCAEQVFEGDVSF